MALKTASVLISISALEMYRVKSCRLNDELLFSFVTSAASVTNYCASLNGSSIWGRRNCQTHELGMTFLDLQVLFAPSIYSQRSFLALPTPISSTLSISRV